MSTTSQEIKKLQKTVTEKHIDRVRDDLLCADVNDPAHPHVCDEQFTSPDACQKNKPNLMFVCPKKCGFCDNNVFCEDHYLGKCECCVVVVYCFVFRKCGCL